MRALFQSAQHICEKREGSGSVPLTNGSGSGWPENMRILQIRIQIPGTGHGTSVIVMAWLQYPRLVLNSNSVLQYLLFITSKKFCFVHWHYCICSRTCDSSSTWKLNLVTTANKQRNCGKNSKNCGDLFSSRR